MSISVATLGRLWPTGGTRVIREQFSAIEVEVESDSEFEVEVGYVDLFDADVVVVDEFSVDIELIDGIGTDFGDDSLIVDID